MKRFFIRILRWKLKKLARLMVWRYRPGIIGVTGSVGKTSTKMAIAAVLGSDRRVRMSQGNFNNEIGLPLTILGDWEEIRGIFFWPKVFFASLFRLVVKGNYPEILVLEYAVDRPGDMKYLLEIAHPNISVLTAIGEIPVHVEFFAGPEDLAREKGRLIDCLHAAGFAILNRDDEMVMGLKNRTRAHLMTFGFSREAEVRITNFETRLSQGRPSGIIFKLSYAGSTVPIQLPGIFGRAHAYATAAAVSVGLIFGLNLVRISEALKGYRAAAGRTDLLPGVKDTLVLDDSYNASPLSMLAALDTLKDLPAKRKIAILGDMLEIGTYALEAHEHVGETAAQVADVLITVGPRAKSIASAALKKRMPKKNVLSFERVEDAWRPVQAFIKKGDLILIKGSHAVGLERIVKEIRAF